MSRCLSSEASLSIVVAAGPCGVGNLAPSLTRDWFFLSMSHPKWILLEESDWQDLQSWDIFLAFGRRLNNETLRLSGLAIIFKLGPVGHCTHTHKQLFVQVEIWEMGQNLKCVTVQVLRYFMNTFS